MQGKDNLLYDPSSTDASKNNKTSIDKLTVVKTNAPIYKNMSLFFLVVFILFPLVYVCFTAI
ncbi:MAG: hypothetical protein ACI8W0_000278 [Flavobacterium sp.]|jgi:hypothetical protein